MFRISNIYLILIIILIIQNNLNLYLFSQNNNDVVDLEIVKMLEPFNSNVLIPNVFINPKIELRNNSKLTLYNIKVNVKLFICPDYIVLYGSEDIDSIPANNNSLIFTSNSSFKFEHSLYYKFNVEVKLLKNNDVNHQNDTLTSGCIKALDTITNIIEEENVNEKSLEVYPNISSSFINIKLDYNPINAKAELINTLGVTLFSQNINSSISSISIENLPQGLYFLKYTDKQNIFYRKVVCK